MSYVKFHRSVLDHELLANDNAAYLVFTKLLLRVDRKTGKYVTGRFKLAELANLPPSTTWDALKRLQKAKMTDIKSDSHRSIISICNWAKWQGEADRLPDNQPTASRQPADTKQEVRRKKELQAPPELIPAFKMFDDHRRAIHRPLTEGAKVLVFQKLEKWYPQDFKHQSQVLLQSVENGWQGIFQLKDLPEESKFRRDLQERGLI